ncbi:hypothetical protein [Priestia aryabhattai]
MIVEVVSIYSDFNMGYIVYIEVMYMFFNDGEKTNYELKLSKLEFVSVMAMASQSLMKLIVDDNGCYFICLRLYGRFLPPNQESELIYGTILKIPVDVPFKKMDGLGILSKESSDLEATIRFKDSTVVLTESSGFFYQVSKELKSKLGMLVESAQGVIEEVNVNEGGLNFLLEKYKIKDGSEDDIHYQDFKKGFINQDFIKKEYKRMVKYRNAVKKYFLY